MTKDYDQKPKSATNLKLAQKYCSSKLKSILRLAQLGLNIRLELA